MREKKELTPCIQRAVESGIPVGKEFYNDIDNIKEWLENERCRSIKRSLNK